MTVHTPEPWQLSTAGPEWKLNVPQQLGYLELVDRELAVACVNACAGINPEAVPELVELLNEITDGACDADILGDDWLNRARAVLRLAKVRS